MKFGLLGTRVEPQQSQIYIQLVNDVATMLVLATQAGQDATNAIEDGELEVPEALLYRFGDAQNKLNTLLVDRASIKVSVETALAIAEALAVVVREIKGPKRPDPKA